MHKFCGAKLIGVLSVLALLAVLPAMSSAQGEGAAEQSAQGATQAQPQQKPVPEQQPEPAQNPAQANQQNAPQANEVAPEAKDAHIQVARDIFKRLIEINTTDSVGSTTIAAEATYARGAKFEEDMSLAVQALRERGVDVVLCTGAYQGCAAFIRSARDLGWNVPISNLSFVGSEALLGLLLQHGQ